MDRGAERLPRNQKWPGTYKVEHSDLRTPQIRLPCPRQEQSMATTVQVQLPDELKSTIDRQIAAGRAASAADYLREAARRYAAELDSEEDLAAIALAGIEDAEAGNYTLIETEADSEALFARTMAQVRASLARDHR
jgi:Arc/MetJ-type ribon-helix-helix transcriptional regulator